MRGVTHVFNMPSGEPFNMTGPCTIAGMKRGCHPHSGGGGRGERWAPAAVGVVVVAYKAHLHFCPCVLVCLTGDDCSISPLGHEKNPCAAPSTPSLGEKSPAQKEKVLIFCPCRNQVYFHLLREEMLHGSLGSCHYHVGGGGRLLSPRLKVTKIEGRY